MTAKTMAKTPTGPLAGIRILDLTSVVNGAYGTQILADQGADVIKLEDPGSGRGDGGDIMRWAGHQPAGTPRGMGPIFLTINRNKRSILLDMKSEAGKRALTRIIKSCDVLASSVRYEGMKRLGLSYEDVAAIKPDIVYVHAAGYGSDGPYAGEPAYDDLIQSASGCADVLPRVDGNETPRILPTLVADKVSGLFMSQAITAALLHRARTKDGYIGLLPYTDKQWDQFFEAAGMGDEIAKDPRFSDYFTRSKHISALYEQVEIAAATKTTQEWLDLLKPLSIPVVRTNRLD